MTNIMLMTLKYPDRPLYPPNKSWLTILWITHYLLSVSCEIIFIHSAHTVDFSLNCLILSDKQDKQAIRHEHNNTISQRALYW